MPSLRRMHEIVAADPRSQAKFFLLMSELHYRFLVGIERLHIGRAVLAHPLHFVQDDVASSLQPCIAPGTTDVQAPLEAQGRGFTHGHGKGHWRHHEVAWECNHLGAERRSARPE